MDGKRVILENTFTKAYELERFTQFIKEFFNNCTIVSKVYKDYWNWSEFSYYMNCYTHIGNYIDQDKNKVAIFAVELKKNRNVERSRSMQRNFISKLLSKANYDAAIVAFYSEDEPKWRLSLVRLDYEFAKGRVKSKLTPAKRYSYLVGEKEPCHTAKERLLPIFENDKFNPTLDNIEEAFNVEKITEEFFKKYREKYCELKDHLDESDDFNEEAEKHNFTSEQFAKKLMGQLAFLYFIQKKGWLGVKVLPHIINDKQYKNAYYNHNKSAKRIVDEVFKQISEDSYKLNYEVLKNFNDEDSDILAGCFKAEKWGSGEKSFIRHLFNNCKRLEEKNDKNFFDDYLEPLFYEALNHKRGDNNYYNKFNCKIPFLNGGLFEPLENYDWKNSTFEIPNDLFSNIDIKGEENADGILDIFDRYNFTMNEDEPLEREVAVDPEMLGKIFENLLDVKDRKSKGAFYTPREIVHYMCQESLINYLVNETGLEYEDIKDFIIYGEIMKDEDTGKEVKLGTEQMQIPLSVYNNLKLIDDKLADVRIADPAVGSGAFPMGMISEIVKARNNITEYFVAQYIITKEMNDSEKKMKQSQRARLYESRNPYKLKRNIIKNSIYAVDIEASAIDITKLRIWLSLVVDEDLEPTYEEKMLGSDELRDPQALPNLDYNIMCGNSLIDEFEGIKLFDDSILDKKEHSSESEISNWQMSLFNDNIDKLLEDLFKEQDRFYGEDDSKHKLETKKNIEKIIDDMIRLKLANDNNSEGLAKYEESLKQKTKPYFLWKLEFGKVFKEKGGFDIIIGNPPYIEFKKLDAESKGYFKNKYSSANRKYDVYVVFIERAYSILNNKGTLSYINPTMFIKRDYGKEIRKFISNNFRIRKILDFSDKQIFKSATTYTGVFLYDKFYMPIYTFQYYSVNENVDAVEIKSSIHSVINDDTKFESLIVKNDNLEKEVWSFKNNIHNKIMHKIEKDTIKLGTLCSNIFQGIASGKDEVFYITDKEIDEWNIERELLKPILKGKDVKKYEENWSNHYVIYPYIDNGVIPEDILKIEYSNLYRYLLKMRENLTGRGYFDKSNKLWYELWNQRDKKNFEVPIKITTAEINKGNSFYIDKDRYYGNTKIYNILLNTNCEEDYYYIIGLINSKVLDYYYKQITVPKAGGFFAYKTQFLKLLPIKMIDRNSNIYLEIVKLVKTLEKNNNHKIISDIDNLVFELYGLDNEDIKMFYKN